MKRFSFLFKDVKEYNKYLLSIFIILSAGIISYNYTNNSYAKWSSGSASNNVLKVSTKNKTPALEFAESKVGSNGLEIVTHTIDDTLQVSSKFATEYRYKGGDSTVKNYVTFNNETWRIIGILPTEDTDGNITNRFKIIRDTSIGRFNWNNVGNYDWSVSSLNTYLNTEYYNTLSTDAQNMIGTTKYYLGGYTTPSITSAEFWQYERKNDENIVVDDYKGAYTSVQSDANKKIALMYASDYGYGASTSCVPNLSSYYGDTNCITTNNWLDKSQTEWLVTKLVYDFSEFVFYVSSNGSVYHGNEYSDSGVNDDYLYVRPVLSLSSNATISGGTGTSSAPYTLSVK